MIINGDFDLLNSERIESLRRASVSGPLTVEVWSDSLFERMKGRKAFCSERERLYMVKAVRYVSDAYLVDEIQNRQAAAEQHLEHQAENPEKEASNIGERFVGGTAVPPEGLPYRVDIAGTWIDQPYVSKYGAGWAITASIEPTHTFIERGGMSTSTRNAAKKIWPHRLPMMNEEMLARLLFCFENDPENKGHISGAQDAIGICMTGVTRHYYDNQYWPSKIESCHDESVISWLEQHLAILPMFPRRPGCSVVDGMDITPEKVAALTGAAARCWDAIMAKDLGAFASAYRDSFEAQVAMFPAMMQPGVSDFIEAWKDKAMAWKMLGAGGGGHLMLVFDEIPVSPELIRIRIRRV